MDPVSDSDVIIRECLCNFLSVKYYVIEYNYKGKVVDREKNVDTTMNTTILWEKSESVSTIIVLLLLKSKKVFFLFNGNIDIERRVDFFHFTFLELY